MLPIKAPSTRLGDVQVLTSDQGGHPPEVWAELCMRKLISISDTAPQPLRDQCHAFREQMHNVILLYMKQAIRSDRSTRDFLAQLKEK